MNQVSLEKTREANVSCTGFTRKPDDTSQAASASSPKQYFQLDHNEYVQFSTENAKDQDQDQREQIPFQPRPQDARGVISSCSNGQMSDYIPAKKVCHTLDVRDVTYEVQEWQGSWWKGCCLRQRRQKDVLKDVTARMESGQLTAVLGNSGMRQYRHIA